MLRLNPDLNLYFAAQARDSLPQRPGMQPCRALLGGRPCKLGGLCRFDHPAHLAQAASSTSALLVNSAGTWDVTLSLVSLYVLLKNGYKVWGDFGSGNGPFV